MFSQQIGSLEHLYFIRKVFGLEKIFFGQNLKFSIVKKDILPNYNRDTVWSVNNEAGLVQSRKFETQACKYVLELYPAVHALLNHVVCSARLQLLYTGFS